MKSPNDRAAYPWIWDDSLSAGDYSWFDKDGHHMVVVDTETGVAFTAHNIERIPRYALIDLLDEGFEP